ncbi:pyrroline-5-carboxylate reductase [Alcaligenes endophyticus]|uniref:Pyrroline-5-carboxylate reductase n=1 Tax=Alcaligenes endophyticus TaxID=1929088 RepID=A0ABT8EJL7_9BURK|nr:pyrroline-5-carboxylate reductase [Alcaligenes endophyticus]MCX5591812.1 pyrroline-5-carboxylate reductase [Alcaligenes endophyticus]MDN4121489.1 pyrroline-5-carboxylate reductase [Alcaligenes endophyticus]
MINTQQTPFKLAFIGAGNMAWALASGLLGKRFGGSDVLAIDPYPASLENWKEHGVRTQAEVGPELSQQRVWVLAVKPQVMQEVVTACAPYLREDTLVISVAAGIPAETIASWLSVDKPFNRVIRCMPNTPAFIGCGITGLMALPGVDEADREIARQLLKSVGEVVWVENDAAIDAVTSLSGSGPAYVFLFLEALIKGGIEQGLSPEQARQLALATLNGATQLATLSPEEPSVLRERVTSKGGTTAAALDVLNQAGFVTTVTQAMAAARQRAADMAREFS